MNGDRVVGNFDDALDVLIGSLSRAKGHNKFANDLLREWDHRRGNDWFTNTSLRQEKAELLELKRLKMKYE